MSRGFVAMLLVAMLVISGGSSALVSWAVTSAAMSAQTPAVATDGEAGADGTDGADGRDGLDGRDGDRGSVGANGAAGPRGNPGATGPAGAPGADGVDAVLASTAMTAPDGAVPYPGGLVWVQIGTTLSVEAAPLVLVAWQITVGVPSPAAYVVCQLRDSVTDTTYASAERFISGSPETWSASAVINLSGGDAELELVCRDGHETAQVWTVTDASVLAVTVAT